MSWLRLWIPSATTHQRRATEEHCGHLDTMHCAIFEGEQSTTCIELAFACLVWDGSSNSTATSYCRAWIREDKSLNTSALASALASSQSSESSLKPIISSISHTIAGELHRYCEYMTAVSFVVVGGMAPACVTKQMYHRYQDGTPHHVCYATYVGPDNTLSCNLRTSSGWHTGG